MVASFRHDGYGAAHWWVVSASTRCPFKSTIDGTNEDMAITIRCDCGKGFQTRDENAGRRTRCPACGRELMIPKPDFVPLDELAPIPEQIAVARRTRTQTSGKAVVSLVLGLCSFLTGFLAGIPAIILGRLGLADICDPDKDVDGKGLAIAGIVLGSFTTLISLGCALFVFVAFILEERSMSRSVNAAGCFGHLKDIGEAMQRYEDAQGHFPPAAICDRNGKPLLSWRVALLPYMLDNELSAQFHLDEAWDSAHNKSLLREMPYIFQCPSAGLPAGYTTYKVVIDPQSVFTGAPVGTPKNKIKDKLSETLLVVESTDRVPWTKPEDLSLTSGGASFGIGSNHTRGFCAVMADCQCRTVMNSVDPGTLKAMVTRDGHEDVYVP